MVKAKAHQVKLATEQCCKATDMGKIISKACEKTDINTAHDTLQLHGRIIIDMCKGESPLDTERIEQFLGHDGQYIHVKFGQMESTYLHFAASSDQREAVRVLLRLKARCDMPDRNGITPLHLAPCNDGNTLQDMIDTFDQYSYSVVNVKSGSNKTPLHIACIKGADKCVNILLQAQAQVNVPDSNGRTALHYAVGRYHQRVAELLLQASANPLAMDRTGYTPIHKAMNMYGHHNDAGDMTMMTQLLNAPWLNALSDDNYYDHHMRFLDYALLMNLHKDTPQYNLIILIVRCVQARLDRLSSSDQASRTHSPLQDLKIKLQGRKEKIHELPKQLQVLLQGIP